MSLLIQKLFQDMQWRTSMISFAKTSPDQGVHMIGIDGIGHLTCGMHHDFADKVRHSVGQTTLPSGKVAFIDQNVILVGLKHLKDDQDDAVVVFSDPRDADMDKRCAWRRVGGELWQEIAKHERVILHVQGLDAEQVADMAYGLAMKMWRFEGYRTASRPLSVIRCQSIVMVHDQADMLIKQWSQDKHLVDAVHWSREVANQPGNAITPGTFVDHIYDLRQDGVSVEILDQKTMKEKGFGALLGVAQASENPPYLAIMTWKGTETDEAPMALVGKGVTFDTGGLSIKPSRGMEDMKLDKTGAVVVCGVMQALARRKSPVHVVAVVALVENAVSGRAQRPGDIVTSLSGQTVEVLNTDAEGRLILADALTYVQQKYAPRCIVDVATLTGAVRVALGPVYAGVFSNSALMMQQLCAAGRQSGEHLWPLPLGKAYDRSLDCDVADMKNISASGFGAGSSTAAQFLYRFIDKGVQWAHLDIAGVDHLTSEKPLCPKGGSAFGVELLTYWVEGQSKR